MLLIMIEEIIKSSSTQFYFVLKIGFDMRESSQSAFLSNKKNKAEIFHFLNVKSN